MNGLVHENVMFPLDAVHPSEMGRQSEAHAGRKAGRGLLRPGSFEQSLRQVTLAALGPAHHGVKDRRRQCTPPERLRSVKGCLSAG